MPIDLTALQALIAAIKKMETIPSITLDTDLIGELAFDSLEITELIFRLEDDFDCTVDLDNLTVEKLRSLRSVLQLIKS